MKVVYTYPPNYDAIKAAFNPPSTVCFTYGDTLYAPNGQGEPSEDLVAHELTHVRQQGNDPAGWWERYINEPQFRLEQEVEAYRNQYQKYVEINKDRNARVRFLIKIANDLASPIYGGIISPSEAMEKIRKGIK